MAAGRVAVASPPTASAVIGAQARERFRLRPSRSTPAATATIPAAAIAATRGDSRSEDFRLAALSALSWVTPSRALEPSAPALPGTVPLSRVVPPCWPAPCCGVPCDAPPCGGVAPGADVEPLVVAALRTSEAECGSATYGNAEPNALSL